MFAIVSQVESGFAARLYPSHRAAFVRFREILTRRNRLLQERLPERVLATRLAQGLRNAVNRRAFALVTTGARVDDLERDSVDERDDSLGRSMSADDREVALRERSALHEGALA